MSRADLELVPDSICSRAAIYNHWYTPLPHVASIRRYCFPSPYSWRTSGADVPAPDKTMILNPVSERFFAVRRRPDGGFRAGRHSRSTPGKFPPEFFDLFERSAVPPLDVLALGYPPAMADWLGSRASSLRHTYWLLPANSMSVDRFLGLLDLYVYGTHKLFTETSPLCVLEALASGIPVVAEDRGGLSDLVVDGCTGYLCRTREDYGAAIARLYADPALRSRLSAAARAWAREHASVRRYRTEMAEWLQLPAA
jgi:glycosyltransferase involved in cell wall biosynthesis